MSTHIGTSVEQDHKYVFALLQRCIAFPVQRKSGPKLRELRGAKGSGEGAIKPAVSALETQNWWAGKPSVALGF